MLSFIKGQTARIPIRMLNPTGGPAVGIASGAVSVSIEKGNGTTANITIDGVNNLWIEVTSGSFANQGKYDLVLAANNIDIVGPLTISVVASSGSAMGLVQVTDLDVTPPTISNFSPAPGTPISSSDSVSFDVVDNLGLFRKVVIAVSYGSGMSVEVVYDGTSFRYPFAGGSTRTTITGGSRYSVTRGGGWQASPTFEIYAIDTSGNEA
jgi:hypothetical protein